jgi:hypothetical protein
VKNHSSMLDGSWDSSLTPSSQSSGEMIGFYNGQDIDFWDLMAIDSCLSALRPQSLASTALFHTRPFTRPSQTPCVSLAMRILRSYPSMMTREGGLPPFVSPQLYPGEKSSHVQSQVSIDMHAFADLADGHFAGPVYMCRTRAAAQIASYQEDHRVGENLVRAGAHLGRSKQHATRTADQSLTLSALNPRPVGAPRCLAGSPDLLSVASQGHSCRLRCL